MILRTSFGNYKGIFLKTGRYAYDNSIVIELWNDDGPVARLTVCLCDKTLEDNEAYIDTNNLPCALEFIERYGLGKPIGIFRQSGYCVYPLVSFDMKKVRKYEITDR